MSIICTAVSEVDLRYAMKVLKSSGRGLVIK